MKNNDSTDLELLRSLANLFLEIEQETDEDVDTELRELGYDPAVIAARMQAIADRSIQKSPYNWRNRADELERKRSQLEAISEKAAQTREEMIIAIQNIRNGLRGNRPLLAMYRNLDEVTDEDLASYLAELRFLISQEDKENR